MQIIGNTKLTDTRKGEDKVILENINIWETSNKITKTIPSVIKP